jgi:hypothetical protein
MPPSNVGDRDEPDPPASSPDLVAAPRLRRSGTRIYVAETVSDQLGYRVLEEPA